ncbi:MAG: hypothetical protein KBB32_07685 [Spirochaetia bacterium]|nr:hypothetical protein [Spirochaetia bacterium]
MKKIALILAALAAALAFTACSSPLGPNQADVAMDPGTDIDLLAAPRLSGDSGFPPISNLPFNKDGAVYLSGGGDDLVGSVIGWAAPKSLPGNYYHGGALDLNKYDPNNLDAPCMQTAITKGAGFESANDWINGKVNVCVMHPTFTVNAAQLNAAQAAVDYYCNLPADQQEYGFFEGYVNIFNVVTKEDRYYWYCTKVAWETWKTYGIDIDSNSAAIDWTSSGLYGMVSAYYKTIYFWSPSRAKAAIANYMADTRQKIVLAEEIILSPYLAKVFEVIRN